MKPRINNNSLRLRLTPAEVARFAETGRIEETLEFSSEPRRQFAYRLVSDPELVQIQAVIENNLIVVKILEAARESAKEGKRIVLKGD